ncbi:MAG: HlyD family efflux transporter periplasmic adaptor subunit [Planctomycetaceae bacterium]
MWKRALMALVVALLLYGLLIYKQGRTGPRRVSGFIEADEIRVGSRVGGRVSRVHVVEGAEVAAGDLLVELEPYSLLERQAEAKAQLAQRVSDYQRLNAGFRKEEQQQAAARVEQFEAELEKLKNTPRPEELEAARQDVEQARAQYDLARVDHDRIEQLFEKQATSQDRFDRSASELRVAKASLESRRQRLLLLEGEPRPEDIAAATARVKEAQEASNLVHNGYRVEEIAQAKAAVDAAQAAVSIVEKELQELAIKAPSNAIVEAVDLQPGDLIGANVPALSLLDRGRLWVRAYVSENRLDLKDGQPVWVTVDSFEGEVFEARVSFVSREGEFTPRNIQTPEERSKQVFRIKVTLTEGLDRLRPGMSADVWFEKP